MPLTVTMDPIDIARFWSKVEVSGLDNCWIWKAALTSSGYGAFKPPNLHRAIGAHRISYELVHGGIPPGMNVRHKCDTPQCCNPMHLQIGTTQDNVKDRVLRDRSARGERNGRSKLTAEKVRAIRESTAGRNELADMYGVTVYAIDAVKGRRSWTHV